MLAQIVLFDGFDPLDVIAPFEVLSAGSDAVGGRLEVRLVGIDATGPVTSGTGGLRLEATHVLAPTEPGYVIVPGASGPVAADPDLVDTVPVLLARVGETSLPGKIGQAFAAPDTVVATVCGGTLALAMAGLLDGRHAVTHVLGNEVLDATGVHVVDARVVDDGDLISAGGVTSGLDLGLHLLDRQFGPQVAHAVEQLFEYERRGTVWRPVGHVPIPV